MHFRSPKASFLPSHSQTGWSDRRLGKWTGSLSLFSRDASFPPKGNWPLMLIARLFPFFAAPRYSECRRGARKRRGKSLEKLNGGRRRRRIEKINNAETMQALLKSKTRVIKAFLCQDESGWRTRGETDAERSQRDALLTQEPPWNSSRKSPSER